MTFKTTCTAVVTEHLLLMLSEVTERRSVTSCCPHLQTFWISIIFLDRDGHLHC